MDTRTQPISQAAFWVGRKGTWLVDFTMKSMVFLTTCLLLLLALRVDSLRRGKGGNSVADVFSIQIRREMAVDNPVGKRRRISSHSRRFDPGPPPHQEAARMARYIVHNSGKVVLRRWGDNVVKCLDTSLFVFEDWSSMATISTRKEILGSPFANVFSVSDGADVKEASGVPYLFLTPLEMSVKDLKVNPAASLTMSLAQGRYCDIHRLDPEDPRCAHVILTGSIARVRANSTEEDFAKRALFTRHPIMREWPKGSHRSQPGHSL